MIAFNFYFMAKKLDSLNFHRFSRGRGQQQPAKNKQLTQQQIAFGPRKTTENRKKIRYL